MISARYLIVVFLLCLLFPGGFAQEGFSDNTRALYILDISRYVEFGDSRENRDSFVITLLDRDDRLYWELEQLARTRKMVQGKPVRIRLHRDIAQLERADVVFVNSRDEYDIDEVLREIHGTRTLLISEGYPFRSSMINFVVIDGKPQFEVNEELMRSEGLYVNELFLAQAVKTREDWEALYEETEDELEMEKIITEQQYILIEQQLEEIRQQEQEIRKNREVLESLLERIEEREAELLDKTTKLEAQEELMARQRREISLQKGTIRAQQREVSMQKEVLVNQEREIKEKGEAIAERETEIRMQDEKILLQAEAIQKQKIIIMAAAIALLLVIGLVYLIWINYRNKKRANILLRAQRDQIAYQKKHITDSIEYAKRIQKAILPSLELFSDRLDHFVLFKPRDIVSGDFYWVEDVDGKLVVVAADCTGHGVPGAFMSMLGVSLLNEIVLTEGVIRPDEILNTLRSKVIESLKQEHDSTLKDGMDMTVCLLDETTHTLWFSGANNPLYHIRNGELNQIKGDKMPVSIHEVMEPFTCHQLALEKGDSLYTFSDGYADQFGGPHQKKFLARNFKKLLVEIQELPMIEQGIRLDETFEKYRRDVEQIDDVVVIGIRCQ